MTNNYDQLALSWVRKEINSTLDKARQGLESFAEDTQDQTQIEFCINCIHQVHGTLHMLDFSGAARLAEEMENLATKMSEDKSLAKEESFEVLMRAILQMPGYLERIEDGQKDLPLVLLPLINEIRKVSGLPDIQEKELFNPNVVGIKPPKPGEAASAKEKTTDFVENAKILRANFQKGLTGIIRNDNVKEALTRIHKVLVRLEGLTEGQPVSRLWWVADGFVLSLAENGQYKNKEVHMLLAQIDKQIKRLADDGVEALQDLISQDLLSQLLYYVAYSKSSNERIISLKKQFDLTSAVADAEEVQHRQAQLSRPDISAMSNVSDAIQEELTTVKDQLDIYVRSEQKDIGLLHTLVDALNRIADTLTLLEMSTSREVIQQQSLALQKTLNEKKLPDDSLVMDLAGAMLFVEANLQSIDIDAASDEASESEQDITVKSQQKARETQVDDATKALILASRKNMQKVKDKIISYIASGFEKETIEGTPELLDDVLGATRIIQFDMAAEILQIARDYIQKRIIDVTNAPKEIYLNALADVITSVEYYLEASEEGKVKGIDSILKGAELGLMTLNQGIEEASDDVDEAETHQPEDEVIPILSSAADKSVDESLIDQEVFEIFIEEAEEEIQSINKMMPRWANDLHDYEALTTLRRSFHTLKGSGRLAGAKALGEFSWNVENLLNKVIEESVTADLTIAQVIKEASQILPGMVKAFANHEEYNEDVGELVAKIEHLALGRQLSGFAYQSEDVIKPAAPAQEEAVVQEKTDTVESIDPVLLEIFSTEAESHLSVVSGFAESAKDGRISVTDELIRALHTLKGSARMAHVTSIASLADPWEQHARLIKGAGHVFEPEVISLLKDTHQYLIQALNSLKNSVAIDEEKARTLLASLEEIRANTKVVTDDKTKKADQHFVSIFLTEGLDILQELTDYNNKLQSEPTNTEIKTSMQSEFNAFKLGADMLAIDDLTNLASACEKLGNFAVSQNELSAGFHDLIDEIIESLSTMLNRIVSEEDLSSSSPLVEKIEKWIAESASGSAPDDMDVELVELFVEEGEELIEAAYELLAQWKNNIDSKHVHQELRRIYHTLKGSARMAGAMAIGELGYAGEDMFNTVLEFSRTLSQKDIEIMESTTKKLEEMIAELKTLRWPEEAEYDVQVIRHHLKPDQVPAPSVVEKTEPAPVEQIEIEAPQQEDFAEPQSEDVTENVEEITFELPQEIVEEESDEMEFSLPDDFDIEEPLDFELPADLVNFDQPESVENETTESESVVDSEDSSSIEFEQFATQDDDLIDLDSLDLNEDELKSISEIDLGDLDIDDDSSSVKTDEFEDEEDRREAERAKAIERALASLDSNDKKASEEPVVETKEVVTEDTIAPAAPMVAQGDVYKVDLDEDGEEVLDIYLEEADELLISLDEALHEWSSDIGNKEHIDTLQRTFHTLKGGARLSDLVVLGDLTHEMETYFEKINSGQLEAGKAEAEFMLKGYDSIANLVTEVKDKRQMTVPKAYMEQLDALVKGIPFADIQRDIAASSQPKPQSSTAATPAMSADEWKKRNQEKIEAARAALEEKARREASGVSSDDNSGVLNKERVADEVDKEEAEEKTADIVSFEEKKQSQAQKQAKPADVIRVPSDQLENLVNLAGETSIFRSRLEQQMSVLRYNLEEMTSTVERLRDQLRNLDIETDAQISYRKEVAGVTEYEDFDPLEMDRYTRQQELTRSLNESASDLLSLKDTLDTLTSDSETLLLQQGRVNTEIQESLMRTRMIPFESLVPRLRRMVRQISTELGKTIELSISAEGEMDRTVLERLIAPIEHMLRNAMDHGIESPAERKAANKPNTGSVKISLFREGSEVFVKIQDDGRGMNLDTIRAKAIEKGLISESTALSDHELQQLVLEAGFSTAEQITQISGRGVGMDVVNSEIKQLGGVIEIDSTFGHGTIFTIKLPFTVSVNHALMVQMGDEVYAIPLANIEGIVRLPPSELEKHYVEDSEKFEYAGIHYSMHNLAKVLDHNRQVNFEGSNQALPVLLLHGVDHPTALQVDELLGSREIVVKSLGLLSSISGLSGATILGDGRVVLILDMAALLRRIDATVVGGDVETDFDEDRTPTVMVVDDSITVRKVTTRLLEREGFDVITGKDGVDALAVINDQKPDVMLLDIEMPRMDGFELATIIRHDNKLKDIPIIMITSRTGDKHRDRAMQIGVNRYMGKPYNEADLLEAIGELLPKRV